MLLNRLLSLTVLNNIRSSNIHIYVFIGLNFLEYGFFHGSMDNGAKKRWPRPLGKRRKNKLIHWRRYHNQIISETADVISTELDSEAFALTKMNSYEAMNYLVKRAPKRCLYNLKGYLSCNTDDTLLTDWLLLWHRKIFQTNKIALCLIDFLWLFLFFLSSFDSNLEYFRKKTRFQEQIKQAQNKEFCWPDSFPDCTEKLSKKSFLLLSSNIHFVVSYLWTTMPFIENSMNEWLVKNFRKGGGTKCLFLIGPTGTGMFSILLRTVFLIEKNSILF